MPCSYCSPGPCVCHPYPADAFFAVGRRARHFEETLRLIAAGEGGWSEAARACLDSAPNILTPPVANS